MTRTRTRRITAVLTIALCVLATAALLLLAMPPRPPMPPPAPARDPAFRIGGLAEFAAQYPTDWEQRLAPEVKPMIEFQRWIGEHGTVVSFADNAWSWSNPFPKVSVFIIDCDGADLFAQGAPRFYNFKSVEFVPLPGPTQPAGG
ncbi:MAG: hypothetical protein HZB53_19205 [Chloroflexi bacterium]|nr:hypothetical protein [Chloroflexota bacterium]